MASPGVRGPASRARSYVRPRVPHPSRGRAPDAARGYVGLPRRAPDRRAPLQVATGSCLSRSAGCLDLGAIVGIFPEAANGPAEGVQCT